MPPKKTVRRAPRKLKANSTPSLPTIVVDALADMKALDIKVLDVRGLTDIADTMIIASGTSDRHVRAVAQRVVQEREGMILRQRGQPQRELGQIHRHRVLVHAVQTGLSHQALRVHLRVFVRRNLDGRE